MIARVEFRNYRCLRDVSIRIGKLTVVTGDTATGKSTLLRGMREDFVPIERCESWQQRTVRDMGRTVFMEDGRGQFCGSSQSIPSAASPTTHAYYTHRHFALSLDAIRRANVAAVEDCLNGDGSNVANVFASIPRRERSVIAEEMCRIVPAFSDVDVLPERDGRLRIVFQDRYRGDVWYETSEVSDGSMLMLAILLLRHRPPQTDLITIEGPGMALGERLAVHLLKMLFEISNGGYGRRAIQVMLATNSSDIIRLLHPEEIRVLSLDDDGSVSVKDAGCHSSR